MSTLKFIFLFILSMIYLIEPYNAYQKPPRKKHWMEIAEEEALHQRIAIEVEARNQALRQAIHEEALRQHLILREQSALKTSQNLALPQHATQPSSQQVQDGQFAANAGAGGWLLPWMRELIEEVDFLVTPTSGVGPLTVTFTNLMPVPDNDTFLWTFDSGSLTSSLKSPASLTYTQTGSYTITLQATSSTGNVSTASKTITVSDPTINAWVNLPTINTVAPYSASITGTHTYNGSGTVTGMWDFGNGNTTPYTSSQGYAQIYHTGSWTASLSVTESSYNHATETTIFISASIPRVTPLFTVITESNAAPFTASLDNLSTNTIVVGDSYMYRWVFGDGTTSTFFEPSHVYQTGSFPIRLEMTESVYGITAAYELPNGITGSVPELNPRFTVTTESRFAPTSASFVNTSYPDVSLYDTLTYVWVFGDETTSTGASTSPHVYQTGSFIVQLDVTESLYNLTASYLLENGITGSTPTLTPSFTADVVTGTAPLPVTFSNSSTQQVNVNDSFNYTWVFGDGDTTTTTSPKHEYAIGEWPVRLEMTESVYQITAVYLLDGGITGSA